MVKFSKSVKIDSLTHEKSVLSILVFIKGFAYPAQKERARVFGTSPRLTGLLFNGSADPDFQIVDSWKVIAHCFHNFDTARCRYVLRHDQNLICISKSAQAVGILYNAFRDSNIIGNFGNVIPFSAIQKLLLDAIHKHVTFQIFKHGSSFFSQLLDMRIRNVVYFLYTIAQNAATSHANSSKDDSCFMLNTPILDSTNPLFQFHIRLLQKKIVTFRFHNRNCSYRAKRKSPCF